MTARPGHGREVVAALVAILLLAMCLRAPLTVVGPLMERIGEDTGLSGTALGLLGALPVIGFGLGSALVHRPAMRLGLERVIAIALAVLAGAVVLRSLPVPGALWAGTALLGVAIAAGNVLAPAVVKRDHPRRIALVTACFTAVMSTTAAVAAGLAVPVSDAADGGWRLPLAAFAGVIALVAVLWAVRSVRQERHARHPADPASLGMAPADGAPPPPVAMWRSRAAWLVSIFMGLQSATFYIIITWLPTIEASLGVDARTAGWHLFVFQLTGMLAGLLITVLMRGRSDLRVLGVVISLLIAFAMLGLHQAPGAAVLWVMIAAVGTGASLVLALSLFGLRTAHSRHTAQLSAMAQTIGYVIAACGPLAAGWIGETFSWQLVMVFAAAIALAQAVVSLGAARSGLILGR